jgi:hypothetical protein
MKSAERWQLDARDIAQGELSSQGKDKANPVFHRNFRV